MSYSSRTFKAARVTEQEVTQPLTGLDGTPKHEAQILLSVTVDVWNSTEVTESRIGHIAVTTHSKKIKEESERKDTSQCILLAGILLTSTHLASSCC